MNILSKKAEAITPSITLSISAKAKALKKQGIDVIGFGAGEPDFDTPDSIKQTAIDAIKQGFTKYTPASGTLEIKKAICIKLKRDNNLEYDTSEIIVGCGAKHILYNLFQAICNPEDEVIIIHPYWVSYTEMVKLADAKPVIVETSLENNFVPDPKKIQQAITSKTKAIVLNTPNNPTGSVYPESVIKEIAEIAVSKNILIISDEVYEHLVYGDNTHVSTASLSQKIKELTVTVNAVSKTYSMTGWRIGYAAGPKEIISAMSNIQSHSTSNPTSFAQKGAETALTGSLDEVKKMVTEFTKRREFIYERCSKISEFKLNPPSGAFYAFIDISGVYGMKLAGCAINGSVDFSNALLDKANVAVVPGIAFGDDKFIRMTFANSIEEISKGFDRIEKFIKNRSDS